METQSRQILAHLKSGKTITPIEALISYQCFRLGARIYDLRQSGYAIETHMIETDSGKRIARYRLG